MTPRWSGFYDPDLPSLSCRRRNYDPRGFVWLAAICLLISPTSLFASSRASDSLRCLRRCIEDCLGDTQIRRHHEPATHGATGGGAVCAQFPRMQWPSANNRVSCCRHKSIIAYLASANLPQSSAALREELGDSISVDDSTLKKYEGLLEKKWTSVVRLQKKVGEIVPRNIHAPAGGWD